jgi:Ca-activated chloride channel family protein
MRPKGLKLLLLLAASVIIASTLLWAGSTGQIKGTVIDKQTGQPVIGALVMVVGTAQGAVTDTSGEFVISQLEPGVYTLEITHLNYETTELEHVNVTSGPAAEVSVSLQERTEAPKPETIILEKKTVDLGMPMAAKADVTMFQQPAMNRCGSEGGIGFPPAHGGTSIVNGEPFDAMFFKHYGVNPFVDTEDDSLSTFAVDVDDASYVMTRSYLDRGYLPPDEAVRTEEFVNHFNYKYEAPQEMPFEVYLEGAPSMFGQNCELLKIGIKGKKIQAENRKPANLVFVIDVSGSMAREDRLTLVKKALRLLLDELTPNDKVGIVVYGSRGRIILEPTSTERESDIVAAIECLVPEGATNAEEGLRLGYDMAQRQFEKGKINRIILCSDGVANVGRTAAEDFLKWIKEHADRGITLTTVGFGMGNYNDILMEKLGDKGNGHYAYVDNLPEARRIFVENLTGTLQVIARDVKIQVDFNPDVVRSYRLLGYENRDVDDDKFRDDKEDGGEVGSGHEVTALYEIKLHKKAPSALLSKVGTIYVRYKDPDSDEVTEISRPITHKVFNSEFAKASIEFKLATSAAEFAEILRKSYWAKGSELNDVLTLVKEISTQTDSPDVIELLSLISKAQQYEQQLAEN